MFIGPTVTTETPLSSTSIDQMISTRANSTDISHTQKIPTNFMTTKDNGLSSASPVATSEVTTSVKTISGNNLTDALIAIIVISVVIILFLKVTMVYCCRRSCREKHTRKHASENSKQKSTKANEEQYHKDLRLKRFPILSKYSTKERKGSSTHVTHDHNQQSRKYDRRLAVSSYYLSDYVEFQQSMPNHSVNINSRYRVSDPLTVNNRYINGYNKRHTTPSPYRSDNGIFNFTNDYNYCKERCDQRVRYTNVTRDSQGFFFYRG